MMARNLKGQWREHKHRFDIFMKTRRAARSTRKPPRNMDRATIYRPPRSI
jgi:hypothetical protein